MHTAEEVYEELKRRYGGRIDFETICEDHKVIAVKKMLDEGLNGFSVTANGHKIIVVSGALTWGQRRDWAYHELYHILKSPALSGYHTNRREEYRANLFAALCRIPVVYEHDTIHSIVERYGVSYQIAHIRMKHELRRIGR
jgi:hypothetical protein